MSPRAHLSGRILATLAFVWTASCISSPELKEAKEHDARGETDEARRYYSAALAHGLRDPEDQKYAAERLAAIEGDMVAVERGEKQQALANVDASIKTQGRELFESSREAPCDRQKIARLGALLTGPHEDAFAQKIERELQTCIRELSGEPDTHAAIFAESRRLEESQPEVAARLRAAFSEAISAQLDEIASAPRVADKSTTSLLARLTLDEEWKAQMRERGRGRVEASLKRALAAYTNALSKETTPASLRCQQGIQSGIVYEKLEETTSSLCQRAFEERFTNITSIPVTLEDTKRAISAIEALARAIPLTSASVEMLEARSRTYAKAWRARARSTEDNRAKAFYLAIADGLDGGSSAEKVRSALLDESRDYRTLPTQGTLESSFGGCDGGAAMAALSKVSGIGIRPDRASSTVTLKITSCKRDVSIKRKKTGSFVTTKESNCREVKTYKPGQLKQECRSGDVVDSNGRIRKDSCASKVAVSTPSNTSTSTVCTETSTRFQRYEVTWCADIELAARADVTPRSGPRLGTSTLPPLKHKECKSWEEVLPASEAPDNAPLAADLKQWIDNGFERYLDELLVPVHAAAITYARETRERLRRGALEKAKRQMQSADLDERASGAMLYAIANSSDPFSELSLPSDVRALTPSNRVLRPLIKGERAKPLEVIRFEDAWASARAKPGLACGERGTSNRDEELAVYLWILRQREEISDSALDIGYSGRADPALWQSTGRYTTARRGPALVWRGRASDTSFWIVQGTASVGRNLVLDQTNLETLWLVGASIGGLYLGGGGRTTPGDTRGGRLEARWLGGPRPGRGPLDPGVTWSAGLLLDWVALSGSARSFGLRLPVEVAFPVARRLSLDVGVEPDLFQLLSPSLDTQYAHSDAWLGATMYLWQSRLTLHTDIGPQVSDVGIAPLTWRVNMSIRF